MKCPFNYEMDCPYINTKTMVKEKDCDICPLGTEPYVRESPGCLGWIIVTSLIVISMLLSSCQIDRYRGYDSYNDYVENDINKLEQPVILIGKRKSLGQFSIVVKDANDSIVSYGNASYLASSIGATRNIGDTIR